MKATPQHLIGRTIVGVDFGPFDNGTGGIAHNPRLTLDNGREVFFIVEETEGDYGTLIGVTKLPRRSRSSRNGKGTGI